MKEIEEIIKANELEIDFKEIYFKLIRNKKFIITFTALSVFLSGIVAISLKKVWLGEFQIVLENKNTKANLSLLSKSESFGLTNVDNELQTEVEILKSPLVLSKVFDFVKEKKSIKNDQKSSLQFKNWKKNSLEINLEEGTSILNIAYKDNKKELVLPVLREISKSYQDYSGRNRLREIKLSKKFFEEQIKVFREKSINSLRNAQIFATQQDITILTGEATIDNEIPNTINIEKIRVDSANEIRNIDIQLAQLNQLNDPEKIMYLGRSIPELVSQGLPQELDNMDRKLLSIEDQLQEINSLEENSSTLILYSRSIPELVSSGLPDRLQDQEDKLITLSTLKAEIEKLGESPEKIQYFGDSIPQIVETGLPNRLKEIETQIAFKKFVYKDQDKTLIDLKRDRDILIKIFKKQALGYLEADIVKTKKSIPKIFNLLKEQAINSLNSKKFNIEKSKPRLISLLKKKSISFLEARKTTAQAKLEAAERPEGVLIEYKRLIGDANKDKATLESLENQYRNVLLEGAKTNDPWELITTPTLLKYPVAPNKKLIVFIGLIIGFFTSFLISIFLERKKNVIFSIKQLKSCSNYENFQALSIQENKSFSQNLKFILDSELAKQEEKVEILLIGNFQKKIISNIQKTINSIGSENILIVNDIFNLNNFSKVIIIVGLGLTSKNEYKAIEEKLLIKKKNIISNIVVENIKLPENQKDDLEIFIVNTKKFVNNLKRDFYEKVENFSIEYYSNRIKFYLELIKKNLEQKDKG